MAPCENTVLISSASGMGKEFLLATHRIHVDLRHIMVSHPISSYSIPFICSNRRSVSRGICICRLYLRCPVQAGERRWIGLNRIVTPPLIDVDDWGILSVFRRRVSTTANVFLHANFYDKKKNDAVFEGCLTCLTCSCTSHSVYSASTPGRLIVFGTSTIVSYKVQQLVEWHGYI